MARENKKEGKSTENKDMQKVEPAVTPTRALSPFEEMDRLMESFIPRRWLRPFRWEMPSWAELGAPLDMKAPRIDVIDRDEEVVVRAEIPGVDKEDLEVSMTDTTVTIQGCTRHETKEEKGNYYRSEISRGSFSRTVVLPSDVDSDKAKAMFKDGILELTIPKVEKAKRKSIPIE
jgi:HSP20 family protein